MEKLIRYFRHFLAETVAGLDVAINMGIKIFAEDLGVPMQAPMLSRYSPHTSVVFRFAELERLELGAPTTSPPYQLDNTLTVSPPGPDPIWHPAPTC